MKQTWRRIGVEQAGLMLATALSLIALLYVLALRGRLLCGLLLCIAAMGFLAA